MKDYFRSDCERCGAEVWVENGGVQCLQCENMSDDDAKSMRDFRNDLQWQLAEEKGSDDV